MFNLIDTKIVIENDLCKLKETCDILVITPSFIPISFFDLEGYISYAKYYNLFLVPPLFIHDDYLCLCLIDKRGQILGISKATHLNLSLFNNLKRCNDIYVLNTQFGNIFLCVDVDIYKPEVLRIATSLGAKIIINSQIFKKEDFSKEMILAGPWQEAQQNCIYVVNANNISSSIIGPCKTSHDGSGFINSKVAHLKAEDLKKAYEDFPIYEYFNYDLYENHKEELLS